MPDSLKEEFSFVNNPSIVTDTSSISATEKPVKLLFSKSKVRKILNHGQQLIAWTPEMLIPSENLEAYVQVDTNPEENEQGNLPTDF
ncbi:unnamed protein product [Absidia cylindrospora]